MEQGSSLRQGGLRRPLWLLLPVAAFLGMLGIAAVYSLHLNYPPIRSDGLGYYLYLPGLFLFNDPGLQSVAAFFNSNALPEAAASLWRYSGPLLWENGNYLIKYPVGEAVLMAPFFLLGCLLSFLAGAPLDGFSPLFQYTAAVSGLAYALAGIALLWKVLERHFRQGTILIATIAIVFGTDLFHYATYDSLFSHVYSFFLFSALLLIVQRLYAEPTPAKFLLAGAAAGLIVITRPTNGIWLVFGLLYGVDSLPSLRQRMEFLRERAKDVILAALPFAAALSLQLTYWKVITGHFVIFSYRGEYFNFLDPQILNVLFSVRKGLFFWSPILLTVFPGLFYLRRQAPEYLAPILIFLPFNIYVISSWHSWFYGGSFGHRAFVESFPLFAICFCSLYEGGASRIGQRALLLGTALCVSLSTWLMLKYWTGVIPYDGTTWSYFVQTFFVLCP